MICCKNVVDVAPLLFIYLLCAEQFFQLLVLKSLCILMMTVWQIFAQEDGKARSMWEQMGGWISILGPEQYGHIDWLMYVCLLFFCGRAGGVYSVLLLFFVVEWGALLRLIQSGVNFWSMTLFWHYCLPVGLCMACWTLFFSYSFEGIIVDSLEAKEAISRFVDILPIVHDADTYVWEFFSCMRSTDCIMLDLHGHGISLLPLQEILKNKWFFQWLMIWAFGTLILFALPMTLNWAHP